ncbi:MAG: bifunctional riboflavin kinase/FAD synthetase [bacterium]
MMLLQSLQEAQQADFVRHLALGFFDGLHIGHATLIRAWEDAASNAVLTFQPHPLSIVAPEQKPPLITALPHKLKILEGWKIGAVLLFPFDQRQAQQPAEEFLQNLPFPRLQSVSVGEDFRFGWQRQGGAPLLTAWAASRGISLRVIPRVKRGNEPISSRRIRRCIQNGELAEASAMLGRPFSLYGEVVTCGQLGRKLGFPTVNLRTLDECWPPTGVYAGATILEDGTEWPSAINIGWRPTVDEQTTEQRIESHLLNFSGDLYGQLVHIVPKQKIRAEEKFASLDALRSAIQADVEHVRKMS